MKKSNINELKYYIALGAPPIRDVVEEELPFMRPEVGFNPSWFHKNCDIDFSQRWHTDVEFRLKCHKKMKSEIRKRFKGYNIGRAESNDPPDLLTGIFGIGIMDSIFNRPLRYFQDKWPVPVGEHLSDDEVDSLLIPDLVNNEFMNNINDQLEKIYRLTGSVKGFLNWQGNLNTAFRFRGDSIFSDIMLKPELSKHLLDVISSTYINGVNQIYDMQRQYGIDYRFATVANCTVNMVGPEFYDSVLLQYDQKISEEFEYIGIHNCAWTVTPYLDSYSKVSKVAYIDMGLDSDLAKAKKLFPNARRNCLYTSWDLKNKSEEEIETDFKFIAKHLAPCDVGMPDIEADVSDERIMYAMDLCKRFSDEPKQQIKTS
ncbi:MAG: hypothetical protein R3250_10380 [Melioribacteraceae bacterium]|nr:hypothetical protein [Melioribacteraceae bacterium]